jgi:hypothetical protein
LVHIAVEEEGEEGGDVFALYRCLVQAGAAQRDCQRVQQRGAAARGETVTWM